MGSTLSLDDAHRFELVEEFRIPEELREPLRSLLAVSFPDAEFTATRCYAKQLPARRLLVFDERDRTLVAQLGLDHRAIGTREGPAEIFGLVDVCVAPRSRNGGIASSMLRFVEELARECGIPFLVLFASDRRLYERGGYRHCDNSLRWMMVHEHETTGIGREPLEELMVLETGPRAWPRGEIDLLGIQF